MASTTVNFNLKTAGYVNYANQTLTFRLLTAGAEAATGDQSYVTLPGVVTAISAANGDGSVSLFRNGKSGIESVYEVILPNREKAKFIIPSGSATIELATLLVDHVPGGSDTQQSSVYAEAIKRANHTGTQALSTISDAATVQLKPSEGAFANGDKTKLNGIETGATADQTNAEIRAAVEAATDSNVFTDDDHTKLNNIAVSTVESVQDIAGALVASGGTKTGIAVTYDDANNNMDFVVASQTDQNFTTADHDKLDAISPSADVTDATTVAGAGALMDSELTDLAGVKGVTISTLQVKPSEGPFVDGDKTKLDNMAGTSVEAVQDIAGALVASGGTKTGIAVTYDDTNGNMDFVVASQTDQNFTTALKNKLDSIAGSTTEEIQDIAGALVATGGTKTGIAVTYDDANNNMDFVVASQTANDFTNTLKTKLDAIDEDVTTLNLPASTTINAFAKDSLLNSSAANIKGALAIPDTGAIAGFVPKSITFPSTSDFLSLATSADLNVGTSDFTLSFWARLDGSGTEPILNKYSGAGYSLKFSSGSLILLIQGTGDPLSVTLATGLNDNKWHVYVVSVDRDGNAVAYVDNIAQTAVSVSDTQSSLDNTTAFRIGYDGANASSEIAFGNYVVLYKSALDSTQAGKIYFSADTALTVATPTLMVDLRKADKTFTDVSASPLAITTNGTVRFNQDRITSLDGAVVGATTPAAVTGTNVLATTTLGYKAGSGGTVTQASNKTTAVTLNKINGEIVMNGAALADDATAAFTLTNSTIAATDVVIVNVASVGTTGAYQVTVGAVAAGSCSISVLNVSGGALSQAIKLNFAVIKAVKA